MGKHAGGSGGTILDDSEEKCVAFRRGNARDRDGHDGSA
jgi:hypothetical protein